MKNMKKPIIDQIFDNLGENIVLTSSSQGKIDETIKELILEITSNKVSGLIGDPRSVIYLNYFVEDEVKEFTNTDPVDEVFIPIYLKYDFIFMNLFEMFEESNVKMIAGKARFARKLALSPLRKNQTIIRSMIKRPYMLPKIESVVIDLD